MKIDILTLFPDMFSGFTNESIIKRAIDDKKVSINTCNFRDYAKNKHKKVDDTPFGGGNGMVLMCQPIFDAIQDLKDKNSKIILLSPQGRKYNQKIAYDLSKEKHLILICGHYEGFDERIKTIIDDEISIGDYVLTGGELPAMVLSDSIIRLLPGVIEEESHLNDSFNNNLLDYPTYTKPRNYKGLEVPEILISGDHKKINKWRKEKQLEITKEKRPDLLKLKIDKRGINKNKDTIYTDDIKNIKVKKVEENRTLKKTDLYVLYKDDKAKAITILKPKNINGYKLKAKDKDKNKIIIVKPLFIEKIVNKNIFKKISLLNYRFNIAINEDDDDSTSIVLGEAEMLKSMIVSMYTKYLGAEKIDNIIKNIDLLVREFIKAKTLKRSLVENEISSRVR